MFYTLINLSNSYTLPFQSSENVLFCISKAFVPECTKWGNREFICNFPWKLTRIQIPMAMVSLIQNSMAWYTITLSSSNVIEINRVSYKNTSSLKLITYRILNLHLWTKTNWLKKNSKWISKLINILQISGKFQSNKNR